MNFRRYYIPNATVFVTNVVHLREPIFQNPAYMEMLRDVLHEVKKLHPFEMTAYVFLLEHQHIMFKPTGASNFSKIMQSFKTNFTKVYKNTIGITSPMKFWQKRFRDHIIRDDKDFRAHLDYIHYNPVKHGLVSKPEDWPHSSFAWWKTQGAYADRWGWSLPDTLDDIDLDKYE
ncbi:MAG: transposase [Caldilineaceae bacterium]